MGFKKDNGVKIIFNEVMIHPDAKLNDLLRQIKLQLNGFSTTLYHPI